MRSFFLSRVHGIPAKSVRSPLIRRFGIYKVCSGGNTRESKRLPATVCVFVRHLGFRLKNFVNIAQVLNTFT